jgi:hypothetical protein
VVVSREVVKDQQGQERAFADRRHLAPPALRRRRRPQQTRRLRVRLGCTACRAIRRREAAQLRLAGGAAGHVLRRHAMLRRVGGRRGCAGARLPAPVAQVRAAALGVVLAGGGSALPGLRVSVGRELVGVRRRGGTPQVHYYDRLYVFL